MFIVTWIKFIYGKLLIFIFAVIAFIFILTNIGNSLFGFCCSCFWKCCLNSRLYGMAHCRNIDCIMLNSNKGYVLFPLCTSACLWNLQLHLVDC